MTPDQSPLFISIDPARRHWTRWGASLFIHSLAIALLLALPVAVQRVVEPEKHFTSVAFVSPYLAPKRILSKHFVAPKPARIQAIGKTIPVSPPAKTPVILTEIQPRPVLIPTPAPEPPRIDAARVPENKTDLPASVPPLRTVKTGTFGSAPQATDSPLAKMAVQVGGFSTGSGTQPVAGSGNGRVRVTGAFDQASGRPGESGSGTRRIASGTGGFDIPAPAAASSVAAGQTATQRAATPVEILFKPKPAYTEEARNKAIEGDVQLEVRFCSSGRVEVLRIISGLGYGLDESARLAAAQIRFRPASREGAPVDTQGIVHIIFQRS